MDPLSITLGVVALSKLCINAVKTLRDILERMKRSKQALLDLLTDTQRLRLMLESVRTLAHQLQNRGESTGLFSLNLKDCEKTIVDLQQFIDTLWEQRGSVELWQKLVWARYAPKANTLRDRIRKQEEHLTSVLTLTAAQVNLSCQSRMDANYEARQSAVRTEARFDPPSVSVSSAPIIIDSFSSITLADDDDKPIHNELPGSEQVPIWLGYTLTEGLPPEYIAARSALSNAAWAGQWDVVFEQLEKGQAEFGENWVNCVRLSA